MLGRLLKLRRRKGSYKSYDDYYREYKRAKRDNPEKFEQEQELVRRWVLRTVEQRQQQAGASDEKGSSAQAIEKKPEEAMEQMREIARAAFMSHPAATEADFRICWPAIRAEMLKQYTLDELAAQPERMSALLLKAATVETEQPVEPQLTLEQRHDTRAFLQAVRDGNIHDVNVFLLSGVDVNAMIDGWTALMVATIKGYGEIGRALLNRQADANIKNNDGLTALRFAVAMGDIEMMQLLLSRGADVNTLDNRWWTPMMQA